MPDIFSRTALLLGEEALKKLKNSKVAVFGIGGVGGFTAEALGRSGVGQLDLFDNDTVSVTNINRQIIATTKTVGRYKTEIMKERLLEINPEIKVNSNNVFYSKENSGDFDFSQYDYIVDAIDTVSAKIELVLNAQAVNVPIISSMGAGNKLNPTLFEVADIYKTSVCPLAKVMRRELKARGVKKLKVVYSKEEAIKPKGEADEAVAQGRRSIPGSVAFVPSVAGLIIAGEVIKDLIK
ncbi:MAG: tRNA threonylcarbamoyladenosine dehydratase [Clostridiales bacterium]|nr:tRNA threonylcarbamoyladenosine dehydratase [Clostridiales bacterium]